jgi:hypothetical protein
MIKPALGVSPDQARDARIRTWKFVFDCHAKKNVTSLASANGDDVTLATKERPV